MRRFLAALLASKLWQTLNQLGTVQFIASVGGALVGTSGAIAVAEQVVGQFPFPAQVLLYLGVALILFAAFVAVMAWINRVFGLHPGPLFEPPPVAAFPRHAPSSASSATGTAERNAEIIAEASKHRAEATAKDAEITKLRRDLAEAIGRVETLQVRYDEAAREAATLKKLGDQRGGGAATVSVPTVPVKTDRRGDDRTTAKAELGGLIERGRPIAEGLRSLDLDPAESEPHGKHARALASDAGEWLQDADETESYWFQTSTITRLARASFFGESNKPVRAPRWRQQLVVRVEERLDDLNERLSKMH